MDQLFPSSSECELMPRHLTSEEIDNPELVRQKFFDTARLPQAREFLWEFLRVAVTGQYVKLTVRERADLLFMYEQLERLVEADHLLHIQFKLAEAANKSSAN